MPIIRTYKHNLAPINYRDTRRALTILKFNLLQWLKIFIIKHLNELVIGSCNDDIMIEINF